MTYMGLKGSHLDPRINCFNFSPILQMRRVKTRKVRQKKEPEAWTDFKPRTLLLPSCPEVTRYKEIHKYIFRRRAAN